MWHVPTFWHLVQKLIPFPTWFFKHRWEAGGTRVQTRLVTLSLSNTTRPRRPASRTRNKSKLIFWTKIFSFIVATNFEYIETSCNKNYMYSKGLKTQGNTLMISFVHGNPTTKLRLTIVWLCICFSFPVRPKLIWKKRTQNSHFNFGWLIVVIIWKMLKILKLS